MKSVRLNATTYPVDPIEIESLARAGSELFAIEGQRPDEIIQAAEDCDALLVVSSYVPAEVIQRLRHCVTIARLGAGTDRIDIEAATRCGIVVSNVPDFCTNEQAEHTMALLLSFARRLPYMTAAFRAGDWSARHHREVHRLANQTLGLVGFGASAQAVARRAAAFGMQILAWTRSPEKYQDAAPSMSTTFVSLDELFEQSDFISIHLPLNVSTFHLVDANRLALMKPTAVLLNTARGAIVEEAALIEALQSRRIGGAALDVFEGIDVFAENHQPPRHPLVGLENVILTPHCAGSSVESTRESKTRGAKNAADVLSGLWPAHIVNPDVNPRHPLT